MTTNKTTILVVEDNAINRAVLGGILSPTYTVLEAENGREALAILQEHKEDISLILLDIVMPVMDGYAFLSHIGADPAYFSIPVIVTTQSGGESDEVAALSHGAADFVAKPYRPQILLHRIANILHLRETAAIINQFQYDRLTGLYTKEFFYRRVRELLAQNPDKEYDLICSDIENFKLINDVFGMPAGDRLLCGIAALYTEMVGDRGLCSHFGADRFACLIERPRSYEDAWFLEAGTRINAFSSTKNVVMKWGIYPVEDRGISVEQMCDRALLAARGIKGRYGTHFAAYDDELRSKLLREQAITDGMEAALSGEQFEIYLQPKYRVRDDTLAGAEALVRWNHPEWGLLPPSEFIPLFEKNGFITRVDQYVWESVCAAMQAWDQKGLPPVSVSVNVSRADIYNADLPGILTETVERHGQPPSRLHLEITESAYTENPDQIIETVGRLRKLGFVVEMDDFGRGYSSLNMLNQMPLDVLKLDMKFIQSETAKPLHQGVLRFIMGLARSMNLSVVAEGVETREQLERLREIGCDYVQGYYFAKPLPCRDFEALLQGEAPAPGLEADRERDPGRLPSRALLVVDEDAGYHETVRAAFGDIYQVVEADGAAAALDCLSRHAHKLAAVVLSLSLPGSGGFAVLEAFKRERAVWDIPVIATGPSDAQLEERALESGAADYAAKPHTGTSLAKRVAHAVGLTASWERERLLRDEAYRDFLTGLLNRRGFYYAVDSLRKEDMPLALFLFDLDNMKQANDAYGHAEGDRLIRRFGELLRSHTRETDIVARFGGDEFAVVMKRMGSEETALKKGKAICRAARESCLEGAVPAAASAGVVIWDAEGPVQDVIARADRALYRAKADGKDGCRLWKD